MFGTVRSGERTGPGVAEQPARLRQGLRARTGRRSCRSIRSGMIGLPQSRPLDERPVQGEDQPDRPGGAGPLDPRRASARGCRPSRSGRTSAGWPRPPPRPACWRTSSAPSPCPRFAAARATATSPSGCTACTPVGEMITGSDTGWPITVVARSRSAGSPATCGAKPSSPNAPTLSFTVAPCSEPATQRPVHRVGQPSFRPPLRLGHRLEPGITHACPLLRRDAGMASLAFPTWMKPASTGKCHAGDVPGLVRGQPQHRVADVHRLHPRDRQRVQAAAGFGQVIGRRDAPGRAEQPVGRLVRDHGGVDCGRRAPR